MDEEMNGILRGLWLITDCPHCLGPNVTNKVVVDGAVIKPLAPKYIVCSHCEEGYFVELKELETDLDSV